MKLSTAVAMGTDAKILSEINSYTLLMQNDIMKNLLQLFRSHHKEKTSVMELLLSDWPKALPKNILEQQVDLMIQLIEQDLYLAGGSI